MYVNNYLNSFYEIEIQLANKSVLEGHDSYEASSCGSGASQDDRSDVASWVALDLRGLPRHHLQHQQPHHSNGYDTLTIDSDFYGYAGSTTGSTAADPNSWSLHPDHDHQWRERDHSGSRHSASPAHYSSSSSYEFFRLVFKHYRTQTCSVSSSKLWNQILLALDDWTFTGDIRTNRRMAGRIPFLDNDDDESSNCRNRSSALPFLCYPLAEDHWFRLVNRHRAHYNTSSIRVKCGPNGSCY